MRLNAVVLPAPLGPINPTDSPRRNSRDKSETAHKPPNRRVKWLVESSGDSGVSLVGFIIDFTSRPVLGSLYRPDPRWQLLQTPVRDALAKARARRAVPADEPASSEPASRNK